MLDEDVARRQVKMAEVGPEDVVLEIGPGLGILTRHLCASAGKVIAIEKDGRFCSHLEDLRLKNLELINADALEIKLPEFDITVSNLPYSISSDITFKLLERRFYVGILLYQFEFARRLVAMNGTNDYSRLSVNTQYYADAQIMEKIHPDSFWPQPSVQSAMVMLMPREPLFKVTNEGFFFDVVKALFCHRRKTIHRALAIEASNLNISQDRIGNISKDADWGRKRVEELAPAEIGALADLILNTRIE